MAAKPRLTAKVLRGLAIVKGIAMAELEANIADFRKHDEEETVWTAIRWINAMQLHRESTTAKRTDDHA